MLPTLINSLLSSGGAAAYSLLSTLYFLAAKPLGGHEGFGREFDCTVEREVEVSNHATVLRNPFMGDKERHQMEEPSKLEHSHEIIRYRSTTDNGTTRFPRSALSLNRAIWKFPYAV